MHAHALLLASLVVLAAAAQSAPRFRRHELASDQVWNGVAAADVNGDGRLDVVAAGPDEVAWFEIGSGDSFKKHTIQAKSAETGSVDSIWLTPYDVDGDGDLDIIAATPGTGVLVWYENPGKSGGDWKRHLIANLPQIHSQVLEDLDGDGRPELVANTVGEMVWLSMPADPRTQLWTRHTLTRDGVAGTPHYLSFATIPGHGRVLCAGIPDRGEFAWWERNAAGEWKKRLVRRGTGATHLIPTDIDGDGKLDLFTGRGHDAGMAWLFGPDWTERHVIETGDLKLHHATVLADLTGDKSPDIAAVGREAGGLHVWINDGKGHFTQHEVDPRQTGMGIAAADLNGDGRADLLVAGGDGKNLAWYERVP